MPVIDASALAEYLAGGPKAVAVSERLLARDTPLWAPHLVDAEVGHVLRRVVQMGELSERSARAALEDLAEMPVQRAAHMTLMDRAWRLRDNLSFYDGLYVALAERLELPLVTLDARMASAPKIRADVEVL